MIKTHLYLCIFLLFFFIRTQAQSIYFPPNTGSQWDTISPSSLGYCDDKIDSLYKLLEDKNTKAFILLKDGKIVLEKYFQTFTQDSAWYWASAGKTLTAGLIGIAQQENLLSISDSTYRYLGKGWTSSFKESEITIKQQLSMSSGLDDGVPNPDCIYDTCLLYKSDAGTRWAYHNAPYTLLDSVIYYASGSTINQYLQSKIKSKIGMTGAYLKLGFNNVYFSNARSMARYGILLLAKGNWNGSNVIDSNFLAELSNTSQNMNESYGYLTWLNGKTSYMIPQSQIVIPGQLFADAPSDVYAAMGKNGQLLNMVPSQNMVWVRMGNPPSSGGSLISPELNNDIWKKINELVCLTGVENNSISKQEVLIYPNPVLNELKITGLQPNERAEIKILDLTGKTHLEISVKPENHTSIDVSNLKKGVYLLSILQSGQLTNLRMVK